MLMQALCVCKVSLSCQEMLGVIFRSYLRGEQAGMFNARLSANQRGLNMIPGVLPRRPPPRAAPMMRRWRHSKETRSPQMYAAMGQPQRRCATPQRTRLQRSPRGRLVTSWRLTGGGYHAQPGEPHGRGPRAAPENSR